MGVTVAGATHREGLPCDAQELQQWDGGSGWHFGCEIDTGSSVRLRKFSFEFSCAALPRSLWRGHFSP